MKQINTEERQPNEVFIALKGCIWHCLAGFQDTEYEALAPTCMLKYNALLYIPQ